MISSKKKIEVFIIIILLTVLIGSLAYLLTYKPPEKGNEYFTPEPETWLEDSYETPQPDDMEINVTKQQGQNLLLMSEGRIII
jgi:hypothetical protein